MRSLTFEIQPTDCVGDSVGKHNYNILAIDTLNCNISSECFLGSDSILTWFNELSAFIPQLNWLATHFSTQAISSYELNHNIINTLSSYWDTSEFTVMYEYNIYTPDGINNNIILDSVTPTSNYISTKFSTLSTRMLDYLSTKFPANSYNLGTRANVVMPIFTIPMDSTTGNVYGTVFVPISAGKDYAYPDGVVNNAKGQAQINSYATAALKSTPVGTYTSYNDDYVLHDVYSDIQLGTISPSTDNKLANFNRTVKIVYEQNNVYMQSLYTIKFIAAIDPIYKIPTWISYDAILN